MSPAGYIKIEDEILVREDLSPIAKLVYGAVRRLQGKGACCWPSYSTLARMIGCSRRQVLRAVKQLKAFGEITTIPQRAQDGAQRSNLITVKRQTARNLRGAWAERKRERATATNLQIVSRA